MRAGLKAIAFFVWFLVALLGGSLFFVEKMEQRAAADDPHRNAQRMQACRDAGLQPVVDFLGDRTIVTGCSTGPDRSGAH